VAHGKIPAVELAGTSWVVRDKRRLLLSMIEELAGDAHISFEGDLRALRVFRIRGASAEQTTALKRHTLWPEQDFVVLPLAPSMSEAIFSAIGGAVPHSIIHIQIEKAGALEFGAYDNFHPECIFFGSAIRQKTLQELITEGVLHPSAKQPTPRTAAKK
jgi:hypothetical protein